MPTATQRPIDPEDTVFTGNPVARAHARATKSGERTSSAPGSAARGLLLWFVVIPTIFFLVTNPVGWLVLFLSCLGFAYLIGFGGIL